MKAQHADATVEVVVSKLFLLCLAGAAFLEAQASLTPEVLRARQTVNDLRAQVQIGVAPRQRLEDAEEALADAQDADLLSRLLVTADLTEDQATEMAASAQRRLDRSKSNIDKEQRRVDAGVDAAQNMAGLIEERKWAETQYDLAVSRADLVHNIAEMARAEQQVVAMRDVPAGSGPTVAAPPSMERFDGAGAFRQQDFALVQAAFEKEFHKPLPISAEGETAVHRAMGFDHRNRVDVALFPDTAEGRWLEHYLQAAEIPYYAFRGPIPGKATGAHIHIGPPSTRI
jgi:hypothetical protein